MWRGTESGLSKLLWIIIGAVVAIAVGYIESWWEPIPQLSAEVVVHGIQWDSSRLVSEIVVKNPSRWLIPSNRLTAKDVTISASFDAVPFPCAPGVSCMDITTTAREPDCTVSTGFKGIMIAEFLYTCPKINMSQSRSFIFTHPNNYFYTIAVKIEVEGYVHTQVFSRCSKEMFYKEGLVKCPLPESG
jgi:hypothetical protein